MAPGELPRNEKQVNNLRQQGKEKVVCLMDAVVKWMNFCGYAKSL